MNIWIKCPDCNGTGKDVAGWGNEVVVVPCLTCHGKGDIPLKKSVPGPNDWEIKHLPNGDFERVDIQK
jgi:hypothetical protein